MAKGKTVAKKDSSMFGTWMKALLNPKETFESEKNEKEPGKKGLRNLGIAFGIFAIIYALISLLSGAFSLLYLLLYIFLIIVFDVLMWAIAKGLGGKGTFVQHLYLSSLFVSPLVIISVIPATGLLSLIYGVYLSFILMIKVHGIDPIKAWPAVVVPALIIPVVLISAFVLPTFFSQPAWVSPNGGYVPTTVPAQRPATTLPTTTGPYDPSLYIWVRGLDGSGDGVSKLYRSNGALVGTYHAGVGGRSIAIDLQGNVWLPSSEEDFPEVVKIDGATGRVLGTYPASKEAEGVAADGLGNIWVTGRLDDTVTKLDAATGRLIGTYPAGTDPFGIAVDKDNNVWIADSYGATVTKIDGASGAIIGQTKLNNYGLLVTDSQGEVWVTTGGLFKLDSGGKITGNESGYPAYNAAFLAVDGYDNLWASTHLGVLKLSPGGARIGLYPVASDSVTGISVDSDNNVWLLIGDEWRVLKLNQDGQVIGNYTLPGRNYGNTGVSIGDMTGFALKHSVLRTA
jgi:hypothetical protein